MKIFVDTGKKNQSAYFGWATEDQALYGLREGYKNSADELVEIVLRNGNDNKMLDTYIFPIVFSYRHSIEILLKHIYFRAKGKLPEGGHDLLALWDKVKKEIVDELINSDDFINQVKSYKRRFFKYSLKDISLPNLRMLLKELQEANQSDIEIRSNNKQIDSKAQVWRYLMSPDGDLYFNSTHFIDYVELKKGIDEIYNDLEFIYVIIDDYLST